jgi:hypothetical protein
MKPADNLCPTPLYLPCLDARQFTCKRCPADITRITLPSPLSNMCRRTQACISSLPTTPQRSDRYRAPLSQDTKRALPGPYKFSNSHPFQTRLRGIQPHCINHGHLELPINPKFPPLHSISRRSRRCDKLMSAQPATLPRSAQPLPSTGGKEAERTEHFLKRTISIYPGRGVALFALSPAHRPQQLPCHLRNFPRAINGVLEDREESSGKLTGDMARPCFVQSSHFSSMHHGKWLTRSSHCGVMKTAVAVPSS